MAPVVLIHGFGFHSFVWEPLLARLPEDYTSHLIDLPGYHGTPCPVECDPSGLLMRHADAHWVGWSMGGLVALGAMARGAVPRSLSLIAAQPRMLESNDWPCAIKTADFQDFRTRLRNNVAQGLRHFTALVTHGDRNAKSISRQLQDAQPPVPAAIEWGLELLEQADLRRQWSAQAVPQQTILGACDALVPRQAHAPLRALSPDSPITTLDNAGHALPLSAPQRCADILCNFWANLS